MLTSIRLKQVLIISGSARNDGDTMARVNQLREMTGWEMTDLNDYNISHYDYEHENRDDDYLPLIKDIIDRYQTWVIATPVYWYTMSSIMKVFFDRFSDLLTVEKEWGRKLRGKNMAVLSSSVGNHLGETFWLPFRETAKYLGMNYIGDVHTVVGQEEKERLMQFIKEVNNAAK